MCHIIIIKYINILHASELWVHVVVNKLVLGQTRLRECISTWRNKTNRKGNRINIPLFGSLIMKDQDWKAKLENSKSKFTKKDNQEKNQYNSNWMSEESESVRNRAGVRRLEQFRPNFRSQKHQKLAAPGTPHKNIYITDFQSLFALLHTFISSNKINW